MMNNARNNPSQQRPNMGRPGPRGVMFREKPKNKKKMIKRLIGYLGSYWKSLIALLLVMVVVSITALGSSIVQKYVIDAIAAKDKNGFYLYLFVLSIIYIVSVCMAFFRGIISASLSQKTVYKLRKDLFGKMVYLPISYFDKNSHGDIMSRMTNDVDAISNAISQGISFFISAILTVSGAFIVMLLYSPLLAVISVLSIVLTIILSGGLSKLMRKYFKERQDLLGVLNSQVEENVTGYKTVACFTKEEDLSAEFNETSEKLLKCSIKSQMYSGAMGPLMNILNNFGFMLMVVCGAVFIINDLTISAGLFGPLTVGSIILFTNCAKQFSRPINEIANLYAQIETSLAAAERVFAVMDAAKEENNGKITLDDDFVITKISFEHVYFSYVPSELVLNDFNLEVKSGEKVALVGATGSGKTTVVNLLMRFYDIDSGSIKINDIDIKDIELKSLRKNIAIVLQDTVLFSDTIRANIGYGTDEISEEKMLNAAKLANADSFIEVLPNKYETILTSSGAKLSQGQRQLLSIARATAAEPKILILDEATSSVDTRTEKNIQNAMVTLMKNRTSLIIAHRLSTIRDADTIIVMDHGTIKEQGRHDDLIKEKGIYYNLYQTQFAGNTI